MKPFLLFWNRAIVKWRTLNGRPFYSGCPVFSTHDPRDAGKFILSNYRVVVVVVIFSSKDRFIMETDGSIENADLTPLGQQSMRRAKKRRRLRKMKR